MIIGFSHDAVKFQYYFSIQTLLQKFLRTPLSISEPVNLKQANNELKLVKDINNIGYKYFAQLYTSERNPHTLGQLEKFDFIRFIDADTNSEICRITREMYDTQLTIVSLSVKGITLLPDLTPTLFWALRQMQLMPKKLLLTPGRDACTVRDILQMPALVRWLPDGMVFDLDRMPCNDTPLKTYPDEWVYLPNEEMLSKRWVRYANRNVGNNLLAQNLTIPLDEIPQDRSMLMIPIRRKSDTPEQAKKARRELFVEVVYPEKSHSDMGV